MKKQSWWVGIRIPGHSRWRMVAANEFTDQWWPRFHSLMVSSLAKKSATMNSLVLVKFSFWTNSAPMNSLDLVEFSFWTNSAPMNSLILVKFSFWTNSAPRNSLVLVKFSFWTNSAPMNSLVLVKFSFWNTYWTSHLKKDQLHKDEWNVF